MRHYSPTIAKRAEAGELMILPWKGGIERAIKKKQKFGTLNYLAMWQGLRGEDLDIDPDQEPTRTCVLTAMQVVFTADHDKYKEA